MNNQGGNLIVEVTNEQSRGTLLVKDTMTK